MLFVKTEDLKQGMRLAKPIYSKTGVLLYGRDTKLTEQGIASIKNFDLIGIYILEPAEPLPPMSDEDVEFERFQAMAVFGIKEDLQALVSRKEPKNLEKMADLIIATYGRGYKKINFTQNLRSPEDYVYKHSLNVAILCALIGRNMNESSNDMRELVMAALIHDVLLLLVDNKIACSNEYNDDDRESVRIAFAEENNMLEMANIPQGIRRIIATVQREVYGLGSNVYEGREKNLTTQAKILILADTYDRLTAMKLDEEPTSEFRVVKSPYEGNSVDRKLVNALTASINILIPGVCVELTNGEKGLVLTENRDNLLKPVVLGFNNNKVYNLEQTNESVQIKDIMKTMDNRTIIDKKTLEEAMRD